LKTTLLILVAAGGPAMAQSSADMMPEGSRDASVGLIAGIVPRTEGSREQHFYVVPNFSVKWSNGVFLQGLMLGKEMSDEPNLRYGPLLSLGRKEPRADAPNESRSLKLVAGAFIDYSVLYNLRLHSDFSYGSAHDGRGLLLDVNAMLSTDLAPHHGASLTAGVHLADRTYMQSYFGVRSGSPYVAGGGLAKAYVQGSWRWQASNKVTLTTSLTFTRLCGSAAASPLVATPNGVGVASGVMYSF
jgi:outer membrane protein